MWIPRKTKAFCPQLGHMAQFLLTRWCISLIEPHLSFQPQQARSNSKSATFSTFFDISSLCYTDCGEGMCYSALIIKADLVVICEVAANLKVFVKCLFI